MWWSYKPYVSAAERRHKALREVTKLEKKGRKISPVHINGTKIASTFWGKAWCKHLESYSDYSNRLPRGRSYVRNGSVLDLQIEPGKISALVSGSEVYTIDISIKPLAAATWNNIRQRLSGEISSIIELLQGRMSDAVMAVVSDRDSGMFPAPEHIDMECSCPDSAGLCKHLAAVLYGVGARLDTQPELLFTLRQVNHLELVPTTSTVDALTNTGSRVRKTIAAGELADVFGVEMDQGEEPPASTAMAKPVKTARKARKAADKKPQRSAQKTKPQRSGKATQSTPAMSTGKKETHKPAKKTPSRKPPQKPSRKNISTG